MGFNPLKWTILAENITGIYRNYFMVSNGVQKAICVRSLLEIILICANIKLYVEYHMFDEVSDMLYCFLAHGNSIVIIILSLFFSKEFQKLVTNFYDYNKYCGDSEYLKNIEKKQKVLGFSLATLFTIKLINMITFNCQQPYPGINRIIMYLIELTLCMCDYRYILEYFVLYFVMYVLSEQLDGITRAVANELYVSVESAGKGSENSTIQLTLEHREQVTQFDKWSAAYTNVRESLKLCNTIFDVQVTMMLATVLFYYIILLYSMTTFSVTGNFTMFKQFLYIFSLTLFLLTLFMLSRGAQVAENSSNKLKRKLCILLLQLLENEPNYKATKDLLRLISTRPIHMQAFGSISVNMTLLPSCVAFFTSYTVIALQFNNVL